MDSKQDAKRSPKHKSASSAAIKDVAKILSAAEEAEREVDLDEQVILYRKAAKLGSVKGMVKYVESILTQGENDNIEVPDLEDLEYFEKTMDDIKNRAAEGDETAQIGFATAVNFDVQKSSFSTSEDKKIALGYLNTLSEKGNEKASLLLGEYLINGRWRRKKEEKKEDQEQGIKLLSALKSREAYLLLFRFYDYNSRGEHLLSARYARKFINASNNLSKEEKSKLAETDELEIEDAVERKDDLYMKIDEKELTRLVSEEEDKAYELNTLEDKLALDKIDEKLSSADFKTISQKIFETTQIKRELALLKNEGRNKVSLAEHLFDLEEENIARKEALRRKYVNEKFAEAVKLNVSGVSNLIAEYSEEKK